MQDASACGAEAKAYIATGKAQQMTARSNMYPLAILGLLLTRSPRWLRSVIAWMLFGVILAVTASFVLSASAAANEDWLALCGKRLIHVWGHHGYTFSLVPEGASGPPNANDEGPLPPLKQLPGRLFWFDDSDNLYFRGRKCKREDGPYGVLSYEEARKKFGVPLDKERKR
jgi:hypothetical protein